MSFVQDIQRFNQQLDALGKPLFDRVVEEIKRSIVDGSELTGAPGQPVKSGKVRESWRVEHEGPFTARVVSNDMGAVIVEENWYHKHLPNHGAHSVALTRTGFPRIVEAALRAVGGGL